MTSEEYEQSSKLWYLVPIFLGIIGGLIAFLILKKDNPKLAKRCLIVGILLTIIPVIIGFSVVLYGASLYQGDNLYTGETLRESITVSDAKLWVHTTNPDGLAWGAAGIRNIGDKVLSVDSIRVRGVAAPYGQWYVDQDVSATVYSQALNHTGWVANEGGLLKTGSGCGTARISISTTGGSICGAVASGPVAISPGSAIVVYFQLTNGTASTLDAGINTSVNIFAGKAGAPQSITVEGIAP